MCGKTRHPRGGFARRPMAPAQRGVWLAATDRTESENLGDNR